MIEAIAATFALIAIGYAVAASRVLKDGTGEGLADFVFTIAIPVLLFRTLSTADFTGAAPLPLWSAYFGAVAVTWVVATVTLRRMFARDARAGVVAGLSGTFSNLVLIGIPLVQAVFGPPGFAILALILSVHLPIMMATTVILMDRAEQADGVAKAATGMGEVLGRFLHGMALNPIVIGILLGVAWRFVGPDLPPFAASLVDRIAGVAGTLALVSLGMSLRRFGIARNAAQGASVAAVKLAIMPALVAALALLIGLPPLVAQVAVVSAAMPTGANPYLIANRFGTGEALASNAALLGTMVSPLTVLFWLFVARSLF